MGRAETTGELLLPVGEAKASDLLWMGGCVDKDGALWSLGSSCSFRKVQNFIVSGIETLLSEVLRVWAFLEQEPDLGADLVHLRRVFAPQMNDRGRRNRVGFFLGFLRSSLAFSSAQETLCSGVGSLKKIHLVTFCSY